MVEHLEIGCKQDVLVVVGQKCLAWLEEVRAIDIAQVAFQLHPRLYSRLGSSFTSFDTNSYHLLLSSLVALCCFLFSRLVSANVLFSFELVKQPAQTCPSLVSASTPHLSLEPVALTFSASSAPH